MDLFEKIERTRHFGDTFLTWLCFESEENDGHFKLLNGEVIALYFDNQLITTDTLYPWQKTINIPADMPTGSKHLIEAVATDKSGAQGVAQIEVTIEADKTGPEIVFIGPVPQTRIPINSRLDALIEVNDFQSSVRAVEFLLDRQSLTTLQKEPYRHTILTNNKVGQHQLTIRAWDANGNMSEKSIPIYYEREKMLVTKTPEITNVKNYRTSVSIDLTVPEPENIEYILVQGVKGEETVFEQTINNPLKLTQLQIEKSTQGKVRLELWSKVKNQKITRTSQKKIDF